MGLLMMQWCLFISYFTKRRKIRIKYAFGFFFLLFYDIEIVSRNRRIVRIVRVVGSRRKNEHKTWNHTIVKSSRYNNIKFVPFTIISFLDIGENQKHISQHQRVSWSDANFRWTDVPCNKNKKKIFPSLLEGWPSVLMLSYYLPNAKNIGIHNAYFTIPFPYSTRDDTLKQPPTQWTIITLNLNTKSLILHRMKIRWNSKWFGMTTYYLIIEGKNKY